LRNTCRTLQLLLKRKLMHLLCLVPLEPFRTKTCDRKLTLYARLNAEFHSNWTVARNSENNPSCKGSVCNRAPNRCEMIAKVLSFSFARGFAMRCEWPSTEVVINDHRRRWTIAVRTMRSRVRHRIIYGYGEE